MNASPQKFLFETEFGSTKPRLDEAHAAAAEAERLAALTEAREQGRMQGYLEGEQAALASIEQARLATARFLADGLEAHLAQIVQVEESLRTEAIQVALAVAGKLSDTLISREPLVRLTALVDECFSNLRQVPHLVIRVHDSLLDMTREAVEGLARERGFEGRLVFLAEPTIQPGDCRIEWANGGIVLDREETTRAIADTIARHLGVVAQPLEPVPHPTDEAQP